MGKLPAGNRRNAAASYAPNKLETRTQTVARNLQIVNPFLIPLFDKIPFLNSNYILS